MRIFYLTTQVGLSNLVPYVYAKDTLAWTNIPWSKYARCKFRLNQALLNILTDWYYIDNFLEILYANPMATKRVIIPADIVIIKFVLIT